MLRIWLEEWFDTLLMLFLVFVSLLFSFYYWKEQYNMRCASVVIEDFLEKASTEGKVSIQELEVLLQQIQRIDKQYILECIYTGIKLEPCYAKIQKEQLDNYYFKRNLRKEFVLTEQDIFIPEEIVEGLCLQEETNASILASGKEHYLPLPEDKAIFSITAIRPKQKVYEGEALITLCLVISEDGNYYVEAEPIVATHSGNVYMIANINGKQEYVKVEVSCYKRELICEKGHKFANTKERIEQMEQTGMQPICSICQKLPKQVQCNQTTVVLKTGESLVNTPLFLEVTYLDGHVEKIFPFMEGWNDNYDKNFCGIQTVTIQYKQLRDTVVVISEGENCLNCGNVCTGKAHKDYIEFPYCTECMAQYPLFTGEVYEEQWRMNLRELIIFLENERVLFMEEGEQLTVAIKKENTYVLMKEKRVIRNRKAVQ